MHNDGSLHLSGDNSGFTGTFITVNRSSNQRMRFDAASAGSANANWCSIADFTDGQGLAFGTGTISFGRCRAPALSVGWRRSWYQYWRVKHQYYIQRSDQRAIAVTKTGTAH